MERQGAGRTAIENVDINVTPPNAGPDVPLRRRTAREGGSR